eukprot:TRINITY_DN55228_c0_g1_i1.p1 TRINITY_DN55228_c0_g1~~TRINITY_DN55228_c0_g1_i1.p1  ORF type:complete len:262 (-),score=84.18 TRINITY_DN55228_c0_g1_i1:132-917(-)
MKKMLKGITIMFLQYQAHAIFNLSSAACHDPVSGEANINLAIEWSVYGQVEDYGYCYDKNGSGYQAGQTISSCSGCLHFNCTSRPSPDFDRSSFKMFWQLASVSADCCQNQEGQVFPLNQEMEKERVDEECGATEVAKCVRRDGESESEIQLVFSMSMCCMDQTGLVPANTSILEPHTCSQRTCVRGHPATWKRETVHQSSHCCLHNQTLLQPDQLITMGEGVTAKCCHGVLMVKQEDEMIEVVQQSSMENSNKLLGSFLN